MRVEDLSDAIGQVEEKLVLEADKGRHVIKRGHRAWVKWVAVAASVCLVIGGVLALPYLQPKKSGASVTPPSSSDVPDVPTVPSALVLAEAVYPDRYAQAPSRMEYVDLRVGEGMPAFYETVMQQFLTGEEGENRVFSPLNVYMGLALLAETADGEGREEILTLLGVKDMDALRQKAKLLWEYNYEYQDPEYQFAVLQLANSLWMQDGLTYNRSTLDTLAENYYASAFAGEMGSAEYTAKLQEWINEQTGNFLKDQVSGVELNPNTVLSLVSTIYFGAKWVDRFDPALTDEDVFHAANGDETVEFMHENKFGIAYVGEDCKIVPLSLGTGYTMYLALPDEDVSVNELLVNEEFIRSVTRKNPVFETEPQFWDVELSLPKFDVSGDVNLADGLKALGIDSIFDAEKADFTPILAEDGIAVSSIKHAARVSIDEEGCTAAGFVQSDLGMGAPESNGVLEMNLNRPFVFCITGVMGDILFAGVVEQP